MLTDGHQSPNEPFLNDHRSDVAVRIKHYFLYVSKGGGELEGYS